MSNARVLQTAEAALVMDYRDKVTVVTPVVVEADMANRTKTFVDLIKWSDRCSGLMDYGWKRLQQDWMGYKGQDLKRAYQEAQDVAGYEIETPYYEETRNDYHFERSEQD